MLKYRIPKRDITNDSVFVQYDDITLSDYLDPQGDKIMAHVHYVEDLEIKRNDMIKASRTNFYHNTDYDMPMEDQESAMYSVYSADMEAHTFTVVADKYRTLECSSAVLENTDGFGLTVTFEFTKPHLFAYSTELDGDGNPVNPEVAIYTLFDSANFISFLILEVVDSYTVRWVYDENTPHASEFIASVFGEVSLEPGDYTDGNLSNMTTMARQTLWQSPSQVSWSDWFTIETYQYQLSVPVPISASDDVTLSHEENIREYLVHNETEKVKNGHYEMEKHIYKPVFVTSENQDTFDFVRKINFNLHFRTHSGDNWLVENGDSWNFITYGDSYPTNYYSYTTRSNQSDLLAYAGFDNNDVKYQKNKLKKSFLRLSFYDSDKPGNQNLLAYSTIFINTGELYSKMMSCSTAEIYKSLTSTPNDTFTGAKVNLEVDEAKLQDKLSAGTIMTDEIIEDHRLSSRISVTDRFLSTNCSEGFNLYLWADNDSGIVPSDLYMKIDFNHAGYGRTIPMMMPFNEEPGQNGFKTNSDIASDWMSETTQYGIEKYLKYSYLKLKYRYDKELKKHIYYLDPERYGTNFNEILNINLYEARVAFND